MMYQLFVFLVNRRRRSSCTIALRRLIIMSEIDHKNTCSRHSLTPIRSEGIRLVCLTSKILNIITS